MKILLNISYLGSGYCGYQVQRNAPTVQQRLNEATRALFGFDCDIVGCSRTDKGVHADMFCATVSKKGESDIECSIPAEAIPLALNRFLPDDICVKEAKFVDEGFHPRYDVKYKEYVYKIFNSPIPDPFLSGRVWHYPRPITDGDLKRMILAAAYFVGEHDFSSYMASGSSVKNTVRNVMEATVEREGDIITFRISANGFLYNMVRIMTGTLIGVAEGKIEPEDVPTITEARDRKRAGVTAPPDGLYLHKVVY